MSCQLSLRCLRKQQQRSKKARVALCLHHQIKFRVRGYAFLPVHFSVLTTDKGLKIEPAEGVELYRNGGLLQEAAYARQSDNFVSGDNKIRVNISPIV